MAADLYGQAESPEGRRDFLRKQKPVDMAAAFQWVRKRLAARPFILLSGLASETAEELFTTPLDDARQVERLVRGDGSLLYLPDADKAMVVANE